MHNSSSRKAQFFILTTVVIVGVFYTLSKYINPYAFVSTSEPIIEGEESFFDNVKDKTIKTVTISSRDDATLKNNLEKYKNFVINMSSEKGYDLSFSYTVGSTNVNVSMVLLSQKTTLTSKFTIPRP
jgi:dihydroxyacetone kinase DhaKLM complex PTS-EIIA-like component DhaM